MKKIILIMLMLCMVVILTGCSEEIQAYNNGLTENYKYVNSKYIDFELVEDSPGYIIVYDKNTKVLYLIMDGYCEAAMTPIYNTDGSLKLYK